MMLALPVPDYSALQALRGLGCGCSSFDEDGNCLDPDPCNTDGATGGGTITGMSICYAGDSGSAGCKQLQADCLAAGGSWNSTTAMCNMPSGAPGGGSGVSGSGGSGSGGSGGSSGSGGSGGSGASGAGSGTGAPNYLLIFGLLAIVAMGMVAK